MSIEPKVTGRILKIGPGVKKLNPHLFGGVGPVELDMDVAATAKALLKPKTRIRQSSKPLMNKLETERHAILQADHTQSQIFCQAVRFKLGNGIWYKPDFFIIDAYELAMCVEVKGPHNFRGGFENLKVAASIYKNIIWRLDWKHDGQWVTQHVLP